MENEKFKLLEGRKRPPYKPREIRCPNCSANLDAEKMIVVGGRPFITCDYCDNKFEITEEPTW